SRLSDATRSARIAWYVVSIEAPFHPFFPPRPFSIHFSTLPHSLPWRWYSVSVVESWRRQALDTGAFFLAPPTILGLRLEIAISDHDFVMLLSRNCTVVISHKTKYCRVTRELSLVKCRCSGRVKLPLGTGVVTTLTSAHFECLLAFPF